MNISVRLLSLIAAGFTVACGDDAPTDPLTTEESEAALEMGFRTSSPPLYDALLENWHRSVPALREAEIAAMQDTVQAVYQIFQEFWDPLNLNRYASGEPAEIGNDFYRGLPYVVVQTSVRYGVGSFATANSELGDFRPHVHVEGKKVLYLTTGFADLLTGFLRNAESDAEMQARFNFLSTRLRIIRGHWGAYWHIASHPVIDLLAFEPGLQRAKVHFRIGYMGGDADFEVHSGAWRMTGSRLTWIE